MSKKYISTFFDSFFKKITLFCDVFKTFIENTNFFLALGKNAYTVNFNIFGIFANCCRRNTPIFSERYTPIKRKQGHHFTLIEAKYFTINIFFFSTFIMESHKVIPKEVLK